MKTNDKWIYLRCSTSSQDFESQKQIIKNYFRANGIKEDVERLPKIEDFAQKRNKAMNKKNIMLQLNNVPNGVTLYCSEFSRLGDDYAQIINFVDVCAKRKIALIVCKENIQLDNETPTGIIYLAIFSLLSKLELGGIKERSRAGVKAAKERGIVFGKANANYGKNTTPEQHENNIKRGNITRSRNKNENYVRSDRVNRFCNILNYVRPEFVVKTDRNFLFYEDFHKVKIRLSLDDYVDIMGKWNTWNVMHPMDDVFENFTIAKVRGYYTSIMKALALYEKNKKELV